MNATMTGNNPPSPINNPPANTFWQYEPDYWLRALKSSDKGLSAEDAAQRLKTAGTKTPAVSPLVKDIQALLSQFKNPLMLLLIGAVILSAFLGDTSDVFIILFIVVSTGTLSFLQERNAGKVVEKLQSLIALTCTVLRSGEATECASGEIVPGDILLFKAGDMIPADCLILEANELHANEASLTGESYPARKQPGSTAATTELAKRNNCLWQGTNIVSGHAKALVINTGNHTIFGRIAKSAAVTVETSFEKGIKDFGFFLMKITLVLSLAILIINLLNHKPVMDAALFALALAVGMAPELLPAISTIAMSAGAKRMLSKKVIVKKLASIQNLGEINLLCTDKTGTITEGNIQVSDIINPAGRSDEYVRELAYWNAKLESGYANPIDDALKQLSFTPILQPQKTGEVPYDFIRKRLTIAIRNKEEQLYISKGAFRQILSICSQIRMTDNSIVPISNHTAQLEKDYASFGMAGSRVIAVAYKNAPQATITHDDEQDFIFAGFILLQDPVKESIPTTIEALNQLQVKLKIITGDNKNVAQAVAHAIGIVNPIVVTGSDLTQMSPEAVIHCVQQTHIFAEVEPQQKENIIRALKKTYTVAYMGDGINDVAAINAADVGISVDNAVDVAKDAADFVLMEKDLSVLIDGIKEGRKTFANTLKYIYINTGSTFGNMCSVAIASLVLPFLPMLPKQILLTNFITDFPYLTVASDNVDDEQIDKPGKWNLKQIRNYMVLFGLHSSLFDILTFVLLLHVLHVRESAFQTGWFIESVITELFILFIIRTHRNFLKSRASKPLFWLSMLGLVITIGLPYLPFAADFGFTPLPLPYLATMLGIVALYIITADLLKIWFFRKGLKVDNGVA